MKNKNEKGVLSGDEALGRKDLIRFGEGREQGREGGLVDLYFRVLGFCQVSIWGRKQGTYFTFTFVFSSSCVDGWVDVFFFFFPPRSACVCGGLWSPSFWYLVGDEGESFFVFGFWVYL